MKKHFFFLFLAIVASTLTILANTIDYSNSEIVLVGEGVEGTQAGAQSDYQNADGGWAWGNIISLGKPVKNGYVYTWQKDVVLVGGMGFKVRSNKTTDSPYIDFGKNGSSVNVIVANSGTYTVKVVISADTEGKSITCTPKNVVITDYTNSEICVVGTAVDSNTPDPVWRWGNIASLGKPQKNGYVYTWTGQVTLKAGACKIRSIHGTADNPYVEMGKDAGSDNISITDAEAGVYTFTVVIDAQIGKKMVSYIAGTNAPKITKIGNFWYGLNETSKTAVILGVVDESGDTILPSSVRYNGTNYSVTSIGEYAFWGCTGLTSITIPNSVTSIGQYAFWGCSGLTSITIPNSVTSIGYYAFSGCSDLTSVTIPNSVTSIGYGAFYGCTSLPVIDNIRYADTYLVGPVDKTLSTYNIKAGTRFIEGSAFDGCSGLTSITIPNSVTSIGNYAFANCSALTSVTMESTVPPTIGHDLFYQIKYSYNINIYVPCGTLAAYKSAWNNYASQIKYAPLPYTITTKAVNGTISVPQNICDLVTAIPDRGCYFVIWADGNTDNPRTIELTQDIMLEAIFDYLLTGKCGKDSALTWTFAPDTKALSITGTGALSANYTYGTFIESVTIGNEVTSIGQSAFYSFSSLKNVIIGSSVKVIEQDAFYGCTSLQTVTCYSMRPPTVNNNAFYGMDYSTIIYVPADYLNNYQMHDFWGMFDVRPLGAATTETTDEVKVKPSGNSADMSWPTVTGAATYELVIKDKSGNVICTLVFNSAGQLTSIAFAAPARDRAPVETLASGFSFTVTGLSAGTWYAYTITSKDNSGNVLDTKTGSFTTDGLTAIDEINSASGTSSAPASKLLHDGQVFIQRSGKTYTLQGQEVK